MSLYKEFIISQHGLKNVRHIKESIYDPFPEINPDELQAGTAEEEEEHGFSAPLAQKVAADHLKSPEQSKYYTGVKAAKDIGMLRGATSALGGYSPISAEKCNSVNVNNTPASPITNDAVVTGIANGITTSKEVPPHPHQIQKNDMAASATTADTGTISIDINQ